MSQTCQRCYKIVVRPCQSDTEMADCPNLLNPGPRYMGCSTPGLTDAGCWVVVRRYVGSLFLQGSHCGLRPRPGCLTCQHHSRYEPEARKAEKRTV